MGSSMNEKKCIESDLNIVAIKTKNNVYISDNIKGEGYFNTKLRDKLFDGEKISETYVKDWFVLSKIPQKIERIVPAQRINQRYELREQFTPTDMTPKIINQSYIDEDDEYYNVRGLYELKYDLTEESKEEVPFKITILDEIENFQPIKEEFKLQYNLIDRLQTHPILLPTKPCSLSNEESYKIIRNYIKQHINYEYASITSDYDFCFTVKKKIKLAETETWQINKGTEKRPRYETKYRKYNEIEIFNVAPKAYQSYNIVKPFTGKDYDDLKNNIDKYLKELITFINEPVVECEHCKGTGVIQDKFKSE